MTILVVLQDCVYIYILFCNCNSLTAIVKKAAIGEGRAKRKQKKYS